ncbi:hypothetical protein [Sphingobacterium paludis]|uniref:Uncharacterized protein n=1 Tax=Sphingobacterium paludis TaxID=1476465 RepID=A0A4R7D5A3_9SPHI|nr:hypothetical protein [Sphingobacterium paludis]TDS14864.1 hypothetical protein B0I21_103365 [Sphingobacterium paludis]
MIFTICFNSYPKAFKRALHLGHSSNTITVDKAILPWGVKLGIKKIMRSALERHAAQQTTRLPLV